MVSLEGEVQHILSSLHWLYEHQTSTGATETLARCSRPFYALWAPAALRCNSPSYWVEVL